MSEAEDGTKTALAIVTAKLEEGQPLAAVLIDVAVREGDAVSVIHRLSELCCDLLTTLALGASRNLGEPITPFEMLQGMAKHIAEDPHRDE